jgi:branched-chain amino acid transport system substrate-binding protein
MEVIVEKRRLSKALFAFCLVLVSVMLVVSLAACSQSVSPTSTSQAPATQSSSQPAAQAQTLRIGFTTGLTGWASVGTVHQVKGAQVAQDMINDQGGIKINGQSYKIDLVIEDDKGTTDGSVAATNKLIYDEKVNFIAGYPLWFSASSKDIAEPNKIIRSLVWTCDTPGELDATTQYTFLTADSTLEQSLGVLDYIKQTHPDVKTLVGITPDDGTIQYVKPTITKWMADRGLSMVDLVTFANDTTDWSPIVAKVKGVKADAIFQWNGWGPHAAGLLKGLREAGDERFFFGAVPTSAGEVLSMSSTDVANDFACAAPMVGASGNPPLLEEVAQRLATKDPGPLNQLALNGFDTIWVMAQAIEKAQSLDTTAVKNAWENMTNVETAYGTAQLGGLQTYGIKHSLGKPVSIQLLMNGKEQFGAWEKIEMP